MPSSFSLLTLLACLLLGACTQPRRAPPPDEWQESARRPVEPELALPEVAVVPPRALPAAAVVSAKPLARPPPQYPAALIAEALEGRVLASFVVNKAGRVEAVEIERASHTAFGDAVRVALASWRFEPARSATGAPVPSRVSVPFRFRLEE